MRKLKLEELNRMTPDEFKSSEKIPLVVVLDNIRSAMNVGSIFRSADAFNISKIVLTGITAIPPSREITKTAIGATESVTWEYQENILDAVNQIKSEGYTILGIEQTDESIPLTQLELSPNQKVAIVLGNEVNGISDDALPLFDQAIEIEQFGTKHSLNISVCGGIVLWEIAKRLRSF